eukprot:GILK01000205.1.p1 GENE.GILK01000205.1~~GILK01000205.1.p1  ORF type:complete len:358 (+),score=57.11 GILK01000205.1:41-1075(+)
MQKQLLVGAALVLVCAFGFQSVFPKNYQSFNAQGKQDFVWAKIVADGNTPGSWPWTIELVKLFFEDLTLTGSVAEDEMPGSHKKLIHSVGAIAKARFNWNAKTQSKYTGLFKSAEFGLIRCSSAAAPSSNHLAPGISVKFFRKGVHSGNFVAMFDTDPANHPSANFFDKFMANHVAVSQNPSFAQRQLLNAFKKASPWPGTVGLSNFAAYAEDGTKVDEPQFPWMLVFQPNPQLTDYFEKLDNSDVPSTFSAYWPVGKQGGPTTLFKVYGLETPTDTKPFFMGTFEITSGFAASSFADETLFFQHTFLQTDFATTHAAGWEALVNDDLLSVQNGEHFRSVIPAF